MKKRGTLLTAFAYILFLLFPANTPASEPEKLNLTTGVGMERLHYEERITDTGISSEAEVNNLTVNLEGLVCLNKTFLEVRATLPLSKGDDREEWRYDSGGEYQTNDLEYGWTRFDIIVGGNLTNILNFYGGVRLSHVKQKRTNFVELGTPVSATSIERITAGNLLAGIGGETDITDDLNLNYRLEYFHPLDVEVTNSYLPGFRSTDKEGYAYEVRVGLDHTYSDKRSLALNVYAGNVHWEGSDWLPYKGKLVKWPENDTNYLGGTINIAYRF